MIGLTPGKGSGGLRYYSEVGVGVAEVSVSVTLRLFA